jgi:hypothetical protein
VLHCRLDGSSPLEFPLFAELRAEGGTEYYARAIDWSRSRFAYGLDDPDAQDSEGIIFSFLSDRPDGFEEEPLLEDSPWWVIVVVSWCGVDRVAMRVRGRATPFPFGVGMRRPGLAGQRSPGTGRVQPGAPGGGVAQEHGAVAPAGGSVTVAWLPPRDAGGWPGAPGRVRRRTRSSKWPRHGRQPADA